MTKVINFLKKLIVILHLLSKGLDIILDIINNLG